MKNAFLLIVLLTGLIAQKLSAQKHDNLEPNRVTHYAWITQIDKKSKLDNRSTKKGSLYITGDTSIVFAHTTTQFYQDKTPLETIAVEKIWEITSRKKKENNKGILLGASVGMVLGGLIGHAIWKPSDDKPGYYFDNDPTFDTIGGGICGGLIGGALVGVVLSSRHITIPIKGNQSTYAAQREKLKKISITGQ